MKQLLLLLPGMLSDWAFWGQQIQALNDICIPRVAEYGHADTIEAMADTVLSSTPDRFVIAGHSMGGRIALELFRRAPNRVSKLGLFCTDFRGRTANDALEESGRLNLLALARSDGMPALGQLWAKHVVAPQRRFDAALVCAISEMAARHSIRQLEAEIHAGGTRPDQAAVLSTITCPTLICAGGNDAMRPVVVHQSMAAVIPQSRLEVFPNSGHMIAMEEPEALSAAMRAWISE